MCRVWLKLMIASVLAGLVAAAPTTAQTQSSLSEKLSKQIRDAKRPDTGSAYHDAIASYDKTLSQDEADLSPDQRRMSLKGRAAVYEQAKEFDRAEADLTAALATEPFDPANYIDRGYFYLRCGRYAEALADFLAGARQDPRSARYRYGAGRVQANMHNYAAAIDLYTQAIRLNPKDGVSYLSRAEAYLNAKRLGEAKSDYDRAIQLGLARPSDKFFGFLGRGYVAMAREDFARAVEDLDAALEVEPGAAYVWAWRGVANERRGQRDLAITDYERAFMMDPSNGMMLSNLRRLRSNEPMMASIPTFEVDDRKRLTDDRLPSALPKKRPQM
jgi:tetratricopeptide (TPR) repeat protein